MDIAFRASGGGYTGITREIEATVTDNDMDISGIEIVADLNVIENADVKNNVNDPEQC